MFHIIYVQSALIASAPSVSCVSNCEMYQTFTLVVSSRSLTRSALTTSSHTGKSNDGRVQSKREKERECFFLCTIKEPYIRVGITHLESTQRHSRLKYSVK